MKKVRIIRGHNTSVCHAVIVGDDGSETKVMRETTVAYWPAAAAVQAELPELIGDKIDIVD